MSKLAIAVAAALGLAAAPVLAQQQAPTSGAGGIGSVSKAVGALSGPTLGGLSAAAISMVAVIAKSNADPKVVIGDDDDDDDDTTTTTTTTNPPTTTVTTTVTTTTTTTNTGN